MPKQRFTSPVLRMVQGSVDEPQTKDAQGQPRLIKTGPNAGQPNPQYFVAGAIAKGDPNWLPFWKQIVEQSAADFPALFPHGTQALVDAGGPQTWFYQPPAGHTQAWVMHPLFSFKVMDGDGLDQNGKSNATKEGFAGCWVVRFASSYPCRCFHAGRYGAHEQIQEKGAIKRGYYIRVNGSMEGNGNAQRPGLYVNLDMVELSAYGPEIVSGPDAETAFSGGPAALPAGASATPVAGGPAAPLAPAAPAAPPLPVAASPAPASPAAPAAPAYTGYMDPAAPPLPGASAAAPPPPPAAPVPSAPPATVSPTMTAAANGATYEQMIAAGWTDETLRTHGMIV